MMLYVPRPIFCKDRPRRQPFDLSHVAYWITATPTMLQLPIATWTMLWLDAAIWRWDAAARSMCESMGRSRQGRSRWLHGEMRVAVVGRTLSMTAVVDGLSHTCGWAGRSRL